MADFKECSIRAPHEAHPWQESKPYDGFVPQMVPQYHLCKGKQWTNNEAYNDLHALIKAALDNRPGWACGELAPDEQIMQEIWPKIAGFLQPEDMPLTVTLGGDGIPDQEYLVGPGRIMEIPPNPMDRIADAVEKIEKHLRKTHWRNSE